jgi:hypothetical protein
MTLARLFPTFVPSPIAAREDWHAWLTEESQGSTLDLVSDGNAWRQAASTLADFQISSIERTHELFKAGCKDFTCSVRVGLPLRGNIFTNTLCVTSFRNRNTFIPPRRPLPLALPHPGSNRTGTN